MNVLLITVTLLLLTTLQVHLPTLLGLRLEFLPAFVAYAALTFRRGAALFLALIAGFLHDANSAAPFGLTALAYGIAAVLVSAMREALDRDLPPLQFIAGAIVSAIASLGGCLVVGFSFKLIPVACLAGLITPAFFFAADYTRYTVRTA
jgi:rod shape-determining protein MreD